MPRFTGFVGACSGLCIVRGSQHDDAAALVQAHVRAHVERRTAAATPLHRFGDDVRDGDEDVDLDRDEVDRKSGSLFFTSRTVLEGGDIACEEARTLSNDHIREELRHLDTFPSAGPFPFKEAADTIEKMTLGGSGFDIEGERSKRIDEGQKGAEVDGVPASTFAQLLCSHYYLAGRPNASIWSLELDHWRRMWSAGKDGDSWDTCIPMETHCELQEAKTPPLALCTVGSVTAQWAYLGPKYGCAHMRSDVWGDTPVSSWEAGGRGGIDPDGSLTTRVTALMEGKDPQPEPKDASNDFFAEDEDGVGHALVKFLEEIAGVNTSYAAVASYKGKMVERYSAHLPIGETTRLHGWSMAKSILSLLVGIRVGEGKMDRQELIKVPVNGEFKDARNKAGEEEHQKNLVRRGMTIDNMVNMRVGNPLVPDSSFRAAEMVWARPDAAESAIQGVEGSSLDDHQWQYSGGTANVLSKALRFSFEETEEGRQEYAMYPWKALFSKIGAKSFACEADNFGTIMFSSFCYATARDWLKIGELVLHQGNWTPTGEQVVPKEWIHASTRPYPDNHPSYTHMWYRLDKLYPFKVPVLAAQGNMGQVLVIVPSLDFVFVRLGADSMDLFQNSVGGTGAFGDLLNKLHVASKKETAAREAAEKAAA